jgi:hypothetical protein
MLTEKTLSISNGPTREQLREKVATEFLKEQCGSGVGDNASKYIYFVETLADGRRVFLSRPAFLNKGFDFEIKVENTNFAEAGKPRRNRPAHKDIFRDLETKKANNPKLYQKLFRLIVQLYDCNEIRSKEFMDLEFGVGYPVDLLLYVIKWFFIEQDITYWNFSGRNMFMSGVPRPE